MSSGCTGAWVSTTTTRPPATGAPSGPSGTSGAASACKEPSAATVTRTCRPRPSPSPHGQGRSRPAAEAESPTYPQRRLFAARHDRRRDRVGQLRLRRHGPISPPERRRRFTQPSRVRVEHPRSAVRPRPRQRVQQHVQRRRMRLCRRRRRCQGRLPQDRLQQARHGAAQEHLRNSSANAAATSTCRRRCRCGGGCRAAALRRWHGGGQQRDRGRWGAASHSAATAAMRAHETGNGEGNAVSAMRCCVGGWGWVDRDGRRQPARELPRSLL